MKTARVQSRCECQAKLEAVLDESGIAISGSASANGATEKSPANVIGAGKEQFQVGWLCSWCGRNTVRSFYKGALSYE